MNNTYSAVMLLLMGAVVPCIVFLSIRSHSTPIEPEPIHKEIILNRAREFFTNTVPKDWNLPPINCALEGPAHRQWMCWALFGSTLVVTNCDEMGCTPR